MILKDVICVNSVYNHKYSFVLIFRFLPLIHNLFIVFLFENWFLMILLPFFHMNFPGGSVKLYLIFSSLHDNVEYVSLRCREHERGLFNRNENKCYNKNIGANLTLSSRLRKYYYY